VPATLAFDPFPRNAERRHGGFRREGTSSFGESSPMSDTAADAESAGGQRTGSGPVRFTSHNGNGESRR
jgi:hypothetical protein